ncbi:uncharacterized protein LOC120527968 [Polypterus senegalus]|uniref:uncharacterized protein LOC120527968 n=1 Tax=Polypterus senegalus TaxID=55291 RepID=UPI0019664397|nr:uncharacterized protein LOC120527968 [Polypterus senegalus]XP_039607902.1 uncharacterized protein LOC120527968 [Polypterus senegalus]
MNCCQCSSALLFSILLQLLFFDFQAAANFPCEECERHQPSEKTSHWNADDVDFLHLPADMSNMYLLQFQQATASSGYLEKSRPIKESMQFLTRRQNISRSPSKQSRTSALHVYFLKSQSECKLLTSEGNASFLVKRDYSDSENQLWHWENNSAMRNIESGITLVVDKIKCKKVKFISHSLHGQLFSESCRSGTEHTVINSADCDVNFKFVMTADGQLITSVLVTQSWQLIPKGNEETIWAVLCPFFIRIETSPCVLLTGREENHFVEALPFSETLMETQLWYWSDGHLMNFYSGLALEVLHQGQNNSSLRVISSRPKSVQEEGILTQLWTQDGSLITSVMYPNKSLDLLSTDQDDFIVHISNSPHNLWSLIDAQNESNVVSMKTCMPKLFLLVKRLPCMTGQKVPHGVQNITHAKSLWYWRGSELFNVATNLGLQFQQVGNTSGIKITLDLHDDLSLIRPMWHSGCLLHVKENMDRQKFSLNCTVDFKNYLRQTGCDLGMKPDVNVHLEESCPKNTQFIERQMWYHNAYMLFNAYYELGLAQE